MLHVVVSANIPQKISNANASQGGGGEDAPDANAGGFATLLADQIRTAVAQFDPEALKDLKGGKLGLEADKKTGLEADKKELSGDPGAITPNPLADLMATAAAPSVAIAAFSPIPTTSQGSEVVPGEEVLIQGGGDKGSITGVATGAKPPATHSPEEIGPAESAVDGKNLPQAAAEKAAAGQPESFKAAMALVPGVEERKPQGQVSGLEAQANVSERSRPDGVVSAVSNPVSSPVPVTAQPQAPSPAVIVAPRVGSAEWAPAVSEKVVWMASQNHQVAELHLNPPNLGPVEVRLTIGQDQQASAMFVAHHSVVREAIETALPRLREMLAESGIMLGNATVSSESFGQQQQQASDQGGGGGSSQRGMQQSTVSAVLENGSSSRRSLLDGMVDIFA